MQFFHARQQASHVFTNTQQRRGVSKIEIKELQKRKEFLTLIKFRRRKEKTGEKNLEKMDEKEEEERSPLILVMPKLAGEKLPSMPVEQTTQDERERNSIEGIDEGMMYCSKMG